MVETADNRGQSQRRIQGEFHRERFHAVHDWARTRAEVLEVVAGDPAHATALGFDQMGHFGAQGCELVAAEIAARAPAATPLRVVELGCGFGGALRCVVAALTKAGVPVAGAVGLDIVWSHVSVFAEIEREESSLARPVQADVRELPLRDGAVDVVVCTGSLPHFAQVPKVFAEAARILRPGGLIVMTEETSLRGDGGEVSRRFRHHHPPDVFFLSDPAERVAQLRRAGFTAIDLRALTGWAADLLRDRIKVLRLFSADVAAILGAAETETLTEALVVVRSEYERGALVPALVAARRPR